MFYRVDLDGAEQVVEAGDPTEAISKARETVQGDIKQQSAVPVSDEDEEFLQAEKNATVPVVDPEAVE